MKVVEHAENAPIILMMKCTLKSLNTESGYVYISNNHTKFELDCIKTLDEKAKRSVLSFQTLNFYQGHLNRYDSVKLNGGNHHASKHSQREKANSFFLLIPKSHQLSSLNIRQYCENHCVPDLGNACIQQPSYKVCS